MRKQVTLLSIIAVLAAWYAWPEKVEAATQTLTVNGASSTEASGWLA